MGRGTVSLYSGLGGGYSLTVLTLADMASDPMAPVVSFYLDQIQDWGWGSSLTVQRIGVGGTVLLYSGLGWGYSFTVLILADMASDPMAPVVSFYLGQIQDWGWGGVQSHCTQDLGGGYSLTVLTLADMAVSFCLGHIQDWGYRVHTTKYS